MNNYNIFNTEHNPIYMQQNNAYTSPGVIEGPEADAAKSGNLYILNTGSVSVGSGSSLLLQAANPSGSGKKLYISRISGGTSAAATLTVASSGMITGGTTPTPFNALFGSSKTSIATTKQNTGSLGGTPTTCIVMQLTSGLFDIAFSGGLIVQENRAISVTLGTGTLTGAINLTWWEV